MPMRLKMIVTDKPADAAGELTKPRIWSVLKAVLPFQNLMEVGLQQLNRRRRVI
jgi:hypothetical protein